MFYLRFLCFCIILLPLRLYAQIQFKGVLLSEEDKKSIPYAHIKTNTRNVGFSNSDGKFIFDSNIGLDSLKINISAIGYRDKSIYIHPKLNNEILIKPESFKLDEVVINYQDPVKILVDNIIQKISKNYPQRFEQLIGEINENVYWDSLQVKPVYKAKILTRSDKFSYSKISSKGNVEILNNNITYFDYDSLKLRFYAGAHKIHTNDFVKLRKDILKKKSLRKFELKIEDTLVYKNMNVISLAYKDHKVKGKLFIDTKSYAIVRVERFLSPRTIRDPLNVSRTYKRLYYVEVVDYVKGNDNKWRLNFSYYKTAFKNISSKETIYLDNTYFLFDAIKGVNVIPENNRILYNDVLTYKISSDIQSGKNTKDQLFKFLKRFRTSFSLILIPINVNYHFISHNQFGIDKVINEHNKNLYAIQIRYDYRFKNNFGLAFKTDNSLQKNQFENFSLGVWKEKEINLEGSWKYQLSGFFNFQKLRVNHGELVHKDVIIYSNKTFDSGVFEYYSEQQNLGFTTSINLNRRIAKKLSLGVFVDYFYPLYKRQGVLIKEKNEFWFWNKSSIFITDHSKDSSNDLIDNSFQIGLNLLFEF